MALLELTWDLPAGRRGQEEYALIGQESIPVVLGQPGVVEFRGYRNPLRASPQVMVLIEFESDRPLHEYLASHVHSELVGDLDRVGCRNITTRVWAASPVVPQPRRPDGSNASR